jgi:hypothetical protein
LDLPDTIASLEVKKILLCHVIEIMLNVNIKLSQVPCPIERIVQEKKSDILKKISDVKV